MKIYASRKREVSFKDFEGQDIWVECWMDEWIGCYIKVIKYSSEDRMLTYSLIPDYFIEYHNLEMLTREEALESLDIEYTDNAGRFEIASPLNLLSTEEVRQEILYAPPTPF